MKNRTWTRNRHADGQNLVGRLIQLVTFGFLSVALISTASAGPREQAKRIHDRLAGVPPSESVLQLMEVRGSIEGLTASLAASSPSEETIEQLSAIVAEQASLLDSYEDDEQEKVSRMAKLDEEFHLVISEASHNAVAHEIIGHIIPAYNQVNKAVIYIGGRPRQMLKEHEAILAAIKAKDPQGAESAMRKHTARVRSEILNPGSGD